MDELQLIECCKDSIRILDQDDLQVGSLEVAEFELLDDLELS